VSWGGGTHVNDIRNILSEQELIGSVKDTIFPAIAATPINHQSHPVPALCLALPSPSSLSNHDASSDDGNHTFVFIDLSTFEMARRNFCFFPLLSWLVAVSGFRRFRNPPFYQNHRLDTMRLTRCTSSALAPKWLIAIRGGDVHIISSLSEVETIINEASADQLVVLDFTANNCPPCKMIAPIYQDMSELEEFDNVIFLKVNVNDHADVADKFGVDGWPTFLLFKNGEKVDSVIGGQAAKDGLYSLVTKHL
jgi:thioredoxin 1